jgi:hypothetical protein
MSCQDSSAFISGQWVDILLGMDKCFIWLFHEAGILLVAAVTAHASQNQSSLTLDQLAAHAVGCMEVIGTSVMTGLLFCAAKVRRRWQRSLCAQPNYFTQIISLLTQITMIGQWFVLLTQC